MTVSIRIAGKLVHISNVPPRTSDVDVASSALLRRIFGDSAALSSLRSLLIIEAGPAVQRQMDRHVIEEVVKRITARRWSMHVVDEQRTQVVGTFGQDPAGGAQGAGANSKGGNGANDPLNEKKKTWVEFDLLDKFKCPVKGIAVEVTLPDGTIHKGNLSEKGSMRIDGIDPGTCRVCFPSLDGREWAKASSFAEGPPVVLNGKEKIGAGPYKVVQGDHIASIAADAGFLSWKTIWDDGKNAALKQKRNGNVLFPGDVVEIPVKQRKEENIPTTDYTTFQTIGEPVQLKVVIVDWAGNPIADTDLDILLDGGEKFKTASDGSATKKVLDPLGNKIGNLLVKGYNLALKVGHLDPVEEISGQLARLNNLGYQAGEGDASDIDFRSAVEEFQCDNGLTVDGICGPNTQAKLKDVHGS